MQKTFDISLLALLVLGLLAACGPAPARVAGATSSPPMGGSAVSMSPLPTSAVLASALPTVGAVETTVDTGTLHSTPAAAKPAGGAICVTGYVEGGGDTTAKGLNDAPRQFTYEVKTDNGKMVQVTYTAFPPNPKVERAIRLTLHAGGVLVGDYMKACGTMDANTSTLRVQAQGDFIETYLAKP